MAFSLFGRAPQWFDFMPPETGGPSERPTLEDLLDPYAAADYPSEPALLTRGRELSKGAKRQLTMEMLANVVQALAAGNRGGSPGSAWAQAASANIGAEQQALAQENEQQQREYRRKYQLAEREASRRETTAKREQQATQIRSMLAVGDKAIELAGGADADPKFATKVYSAMRERNASALQGLLDQAPGRRIMREAGHNPDDPLDMEKWEAERDLEEKKTEEGVLGPIRSAREIKDYEEKKRIDRRYPAPREPDRDRVWFDPTTGQVVNMDAALRGAGGAPVSSPVPGYSPRPRNGQQFDDVEREAMDAADRAQTAYERDPYKPVYQNANANAPYFTRDPNVVGRDVPFNWEADYRAKERTFRKIAAEKQAKADPSVGNRGAAPVVSPDRRGVQDPKGAPIGMGGGPVKDPQKTAEVERKVAQVQARVGAMTEAQKKVVRQQAATLTVDQIVAQINAARQRARKKGTPGG